MKSPYPYFGGKSRVADVIWKRLGNVDNYVEPFFGSGAVLLSQALDESRIETVNDIDGYVSNFWRAISSDPEQVAHHADWPVNENDLHARHSWLVSRKDEMRAKLEGDASWCDCQIAGWWVWGIACWIGGSFCATDGPWHVVDGELVDVRQLPHLGDAGRGIHRQLPHLGDAGRGIHRQRQSIHDYFDAMSDRMRRVRVCCGDWSRVVTPSVTTVHGLTAVFLDPPYSAEDRTDVYSHECRQVAKSCASWARDHGHEMRIAICGYEGEHDMQGWDVFRWSSSGMGKRGCRGDTNRHRETIWFSPLCIPSDSHRQQPLFE